MVETKILIGVDVGKSRSGIARATGTLTEPLTVIGEKDIKRLAQKIKKLAIAEGAQAIVVGVPQGEIEPLALGLGKLLEMQGLKVVLWDETLTTQDAQRLAISANMPLKKRRMFEDAYAAAVMLQSYIDSTQTFFEKESLAKKKQKGKEAEKTSRLSLSKVMFKTLIAPVQAWLMSQGRCVACGRELAVGKSEKSKKVPAMVKVMCQCGRIFLKDRKTNKYRRALMSEI